MMLKTFLWLLTALFMHGCTTSGSGPVTLENAPTKSHTLTADNGKILSFKSTGCVLKEGALRNKTGYASAGSYGKLLTTNSNTSATIDQYHVSCSAVPAGGQSACVIQHVDGSGRPQHYGGAGCPDMKFKLIDFKSF